MKVHPDTYMLPRITQDKLEALSNDIRLNGLREPIKIIEHKGEKVILDGRNRFQACEMAGVEPTFEEVPSDTDTLSYVVSQNIDRG